MTKNTSFKDLVKKYQTNKPKIQNKTSNNKNTATTTNPEKGEKPQFSHYIIELSHYIIKNVHFDTKNYEACKETDLSIESTLEEANLLDLLDRDIKSAFKDMF